LDFEKFDPSEPRDAKGEWTSEGKSEPVTIREAESQFKERMGAKSVTYGNLDVNVANEWNKTLVDYHDKYPEAMNRFKIFGSMQEFNRQMIDNVKKIVIPDIKKAYLSRHGAPISDKEAEQKADDIAKEMVPDPSNAYASTHIDRVTSDKNGIFINEYMDKEEMDKSLKNGVDKKIHPIGCDTIKSIADHECGHVLSYKFNIMGDEIVKELWRKFHNEYNDQEDQLSSYANTNIGEFVAEAWAEYKNNPNPRMIAKTVGDIIEKRVQDDRQN
jgi:hypothetical protein